MSLKPFVTFSTTTVAIFSFFSATIGRAQMVDVNGNGMSDVWEWVYNATNLPPDVDTDADAVLNAELVTRVERQFEAAGTRTG